MSIRKKKWRNINYEVAFLQEEIIQERAILQGLQRLWEVARCAWIYIECNKYATNILICTGHFQRNLGMSNNRVWEGKDTVMKKLDCRRKMEMNKKAEYYKINESDWDGIWYPVGGRKGYDCCAGK